LAAFPFAKPAGGRTIRRVAPPVPRSRSSLFWLLQIGGWLIAIPVFVLVLLVVFADPATAVLVGVIRQAMGFLITLVLWAIYRRWPARGFPFAQHAWKIALGCIFATLADYFLAEVIRHAMNLPPLPEFALRGSFFVRLAIYVAWSALYFGIRQELESHAQDLELARAEASAREAELQLLRAQVNPHFVFNALSSIVGHVHDNPAAVTEITYAVSDYLRYSLSQRAHRAKLGDELAAMTNYLRVERLNRGEKHLDWVIDATVAAGTALAPTALVQPLVENAIKYGLRTSTMPLRLRVRAEVVGPELVVSVENTGRWLEPGGDGPARASTGIGLANLRRRLALLCGGQAGLTVHTPEGRVRVEVRVPFVPAE
jgi:signal transduction histidine kinase